MNVIGTVIIIIMSVYSMVILKKYLSLFFYQRKGLWKAAVWSLFFVWQIIININVGRRGFGGGLNIIVSLGVIYLVSIFGYAGSLWKKTVFCFLFSSLWMISEPLVRYGMMYLNGSGEPSVLQVSILSKLLLCLFVLLIYWIMRRGNSKNGVKLDGMSGFLLTMLPFSSIMIYYIFNRTGEMAGTEYVSGMLSVGAILLLIINLLMYPIYIKLEEGVHDKIKSRYYIHQMKNYRHYNAEMEEAVTEIRETRHDLKHRLIYLQEVMKSSELSIVEQTLNQFVGLVEQSGKKVSETGNLEIDALLNWKSKEINKIDGKLHTEIEVPAELGFDEGDLSVLLGNSLDNAIEALTYLEREKREIWIKLKYAKGTLLMEVKNYCDGAFQYDDQGRLASRKQDPGHGLGYHSMERIVGKYKGDLDVKINDDTFILSVFLFCKNQKM